MGDRNSYSCLIVQIIRESFIPGMHIQGGYLSVVRPQHIYSWALSITNTVKRNEFCIYNILSMLLDKSVEIILNSAFLVSCYLSSQTLSDWAQISSDSEQ